ncbi:MAG: nitrile hydratase subunit alpha [SAR324 cluster bacterium]|nr:nitrile hydratase subunit alpha [SAR324 cluster bacterium]
MQQYESIIQKAWTDASFKSRLLTSPKAAFAEMGYDFGNMDVKVFDDAGDNAHFVLLTKEQAASVDLENDQVLGRVTKKALEDSNYKTRLISDTTAAVREVLGVEPPLNILVHENTDKVINLVIPANPETAGELSDTDLSMVAGGKGLVINCETIAGALTGAGNLTAKVGSYLPGNFGGLFSSLGPIMTGGGSMVGKTSNFLGFMGA